MSRVGLVLAPARVLVLTNALVLALALTLVGVPRAAAIEVLPSESRLGDAEAVVVVRAEGSLLVRSQPPILVAAGEGDRGVLAPRAVEPRGTWHGMEGVVELRLEREHPAATVEIFLEDATDVGAWIEWPGAASAVAAASAPREMPGAGGLAPLAALVVGAVLMRRRAAGRACATR